MRRGHNMHRTHPQGHARRFDAAAIRATGAVGLLALYISGCVDTEPGAGWTVRDSTGVEIVSNTGEPSAWELSGEPLLEVGSADEPGPSQLYRVSDVALLADGGLAVANQGSEELRIFATDGAFRASAGGKGHGPREFDGLAMVRPIGDSLFTWDGGNQRISVRLLDGSLARTFRLEWTEGILLPVDVLGAASTGERRVLAVTGRHMTQLRGSGLVVDTALVSVYDMEGALIDSLARVPHNARVVLREGNVQTTLGAPYTTFASIVGDERGFCHTFGPEPEIGCHDATGPRRIIRVDLPKRAVTAEDIDRYWEEAVASASEPRRAALRRMRDVMPFPEHFPAFAQLLRDDRGRLWGRRYAARADTADEWLILDDARWIGRLATPTGFRVMDVRGDRLAGVWRDTMGIEFVRVYGYRPR